MMKKLILLPYFILLTLIAFGQGSIQYNLCNQDFSPLYLRTNLPSNAVYTDTNATPAARASDVLKRLSFDEKLTLTGGWNQMHFPSISRLGLRPIYFSDASQGIHIKHICVEVDSSTAFPCELALAATWNPRLAYQYAQSIGEECQAWGVSVLLGPGLNMYRNAEGGRNFEYMGEDPFLTSVMGVKYVQGLQKTGTLATIKHFIVNDQEFARHVANVKVGERALREIYLPPFLNAIQQGDAIAIMTGNNFVNGYPGAANKPISRDIIREEYGYKGIIMSDWANGMYWRDRQNLELSSGHSLLMSNNKIFATYIQDVIHQHPEKKPVIEKGLDSMVFYNLYTFFKAGFYDRPYKNPALVNKIKGHKKVALQTAEEAITLLKNEDNILPITPQKNKKIIVIGTEKALTAYAGRGSGHVDGYDRIDYLAGLKKVYGTNIIQGNKASNADIKSADIVLYFIFKDCGEGRDVPFDMPDIDQEISHYADLNKNLIVVYSGGNGLAMPWLSRVKGFIFAYLLGQQSGPALAHVISGSVNPSGKLPFTIEKDFKDSPAFDYNKMKDGKYYWGGGKGIEDKYADMFGDIELTYKEGIYIGYRWYDKNKIQPQFPFGYGLSYTTFSISNIKALSGSLQKGKPDTISFTISNTGKTAGAETAQLYIHPTNPAIDRPIKELKGFRKVYLQPGESKTVYIPVNAHDIAYWSEKTHEWKIDSGNYLVEVGTSSRDIKQEIMIKTAF